MKGCSIACNSQQVFAVLRLYQILYTDLLGWNINTTSKCQMTLVTSCFRNIWSIYFSNTQYNEIFKVIWTVGHKVQPAWDFTNANFYSWELYQQRTFIYLISFHLSHVLMVTTESSLVSWTRWKLLVSSSWSEHQGQNFQPLLVWHSSISLSIIAVWRHAVS